MISKPSGRPPEQGARHGLAFIGLALLLIGGIRHASARTLSPSDPIEPRYYDNLPPAPGSDSISLPAAYVLAVAWPHSSVTYAILNCPRSLDCEAARTAVRQAAAAWDDASGLTLTEVSGNADIRISWVTGDHGDGFPLDGPGGDLGHTFFPAPALGSLAGDIHLDDDEIWVVGPADEPGEVDLMTTILHELGHALGLDHSWDPYALMWPLYTGIRGLAPDDVAGIQQLYGPPDAGDAEPASDIGSVNATASDTLRLRAGPDTTYPQIDSIPAGTTLPVLGRDSAGDWLYVDFLGQRGWVAGWYCTLSGSLSGVPVVPADGSGASAPSTPLPAPGAVTAESGFTLRLRSGPGMDSAQIGTIPAGTGMIVLGRNASGQWLYVASGAQRGWVAGWLCTVKGDLGSVPTLD